MEPRSSETTDEIKNTNPSPYSLQRLYELAVRIDACHAVFQMEFERLLEGAAGTKLDHHEELIEFRDAFRAVSRRLSVHPLQQDGTPGTLQIKRYKGREGAWALISSSKTNRSCGAAANTIPHLSLGRD